jgi:hypothetical protein
MECKCLERFIDENDPWKRIIAGYGWIIERKGEDRKYWVRLGAENKYFATEKAAKLSFSNFVKAKQKQYA